LISEETRMAHHREHASETYVLRPEAWSAVRNSLALVALVSWLALAAGYALYGMPQVGFIHRMGEASVRFWLFGWRVWPSRSPRRHYFLFRNAVILMRRDYVPAVWKAWAVAKLLVTFAVHALTDPRRKEQCRAMLRGLREGLESKAIR